MATLNPGTIVNSKPGIKKKKKDSIICNNLNCHFWAGMRESNSEEAPVTKCVLTAFLFCALLLLHTATRRRLGVGLEC